MNKKPYEKPDLMIVGDMHLRDDQPKCRIKNFVETQIEKFRWLKKTWVALERPHIIQTGDLFHKWNSNPFVINMALSHLPPMITIPGNPGKHNYFTEEGFDRDALSIMKSSRENWRVLTPDHNKEPNEWFRRSIGVTSKTSVEISITPMFWGEPVIPKAPETMAMGGSFKILLTHQMVEYEDNRLLMEAAINGYDLVCSGHNHQPFVQHYEKSSLCNAGSFTRQTASETHNPVIWLYYAKRRELVSVSVPIDVEDLTRTHIDSVEERNNKLEEFVSYLVSSDATVTINFKANLLDFLNKNKETLDNPIIERLMEAMDHGKRN